MAAATNKCHALFVYSALFVVTLVLISSASSQCVDGVYKHGDKNCCMCPKGYKLVEHCEQNEGHAKCELCNDGTFSSHPRSEETCDQCTDCTHPNENLEVETICTPLTDAKCRCKQDHYCISGKETCRLCHPCTKCGPEGIETICAGNNDTVCKKVNKGGSRAAIIAPVVICIVLALVITLVVVTCWKLRRFRFRKLNMISRRHKKAQSEMKLLSAVPDVDIEPLIPDIAEVLGWKDMQDIAMRSRMPNNVIESCKLDHPGDAEQQTLQLLRLWVERQGKTAPQTLIRILRQSCKKATEEKVMDILTKASGPNDQNSQNAEA